eukprot:3408962-Prymnesium_polylepis.1
MVRVPLASFVPRLTIKPSLPTPSVNQAGGLPLVKNGGSGEPGGRAPVGQERRQSDREARGRRGPG